jgi:hypothetical protein
MVTLTPDPSPAKKKARERGVILLSETGNRKPETGNQRRKTRDLRPETRDPRPTDRGERE